MRRSVRKMILRTIWRTRNRFLAIFAITALGVGFLTGLMCTGPDMKNSVDRYYDAAGFMDIDIKSTLGLSAEDVQTISGMKGVRAVLPVIQQDLVVENSEGGQKTARITGIGFEEDAGVVNRLTLVEGRMPEAADECVQVKMGPFTGMDPLGSRIILDPESRVGEEPPGEAGPQGDGGEKDSEEEDKLSVDTDVDVDVDVEDTSLVRFHDELTVVGYVVSPMVVSVESETTSAGNGILAAYYYAPKALFDTDISTDIYVTVEGAEELSAFTDQYQDLVDLRAGEMEDIAPEREQIRYAEIQKEAESKIADAESEYREKRSEAESELADAESELADAESEIADGESELADGKKELKDARKELADAREELDDAAEELADSRKKLDDAAAELDDGRKELDDGRKELKSARKKLDKAKPDIRKAKDAIRENEPKIQEAKAAIEQYEVGREEYSAGKKELKKSRKKLDQGWDEYRKSKTEYEKNREAAEKQFVAAEAELDKAKAELDQGKKQLREQKKELQRAKKSLDKLKKTVDQLNELKKQGIKLTAEQKAVIAAYKEAKKQYKAGEKAYKQAEKQLSAAEKEYNAGRKKFQKEKKAAEEQLDDALRQLTDARNQLDQGEKEYSSGEKKLKKAKEELAAAKPQIKEARKAVKEWEKTYPKLKKAIADYNKGEKQYKKGKKKLDKAESKYQDGLKEYRDGEKKYADGLKEYEDGEKEYADGLKEYRDGRKEYKDNVRKLKDAKKDYADGKQEYLDASREAEDAFADAEEKLADARQKVSDLESPEWYVLDRNINPTFVSFAGNADKITAIAKVFPIFFFLVAALVALTTMTRMVEEERSEIGTMKALGYSSRVIAGKYMLYAGVAGILGSVTGVLVGQWIFPVILWNAYGIMYYYTGFRTAFLAQYALPSAAAAIISVMAATGWAVSESLKETPARLMQPKAPKAGKRILLEYVKPVWKRMKFTYKVTARNLFRYKKRFFMTIIGIAGCTALLLTGFGVRDSIGNIVSIQFEDLQKYRLTLSLKSDAEEEEKEEIRNWLQNRDEPWFSVYSEVGNAVHGKKKEALTIEVPIQAEGFTEYVDLRDRVTGESLPFDENSVILTEKMAKIVGVKAGEVFLLEDSDENRAELTVTGITENYLRGFAYIGKDAWQQAFGEEASENTWLVKSRAASDAEEDAEVTELLKFDGVYTAQFCTYLIKTFDNMLSKIDYIVVVLIVCAGLLAFVVLYNLTNINISERQREIATIKVLGFFPGEVNAYIFRETFLLSLFGIAAGLVGGIFLHRFVIINAEVSSVMFGRRIYPMSYVWSALITLLFTALVSVVLSRTLKRIDMVESLKSVD